MQGILQHGQCSQNQGKLDEAIELTTSTLIKPDYVGAYNNMGMLSKKVNLSQ